MSENAKKVWKIAERNDLATVLEHVIDDLEAFADDLERDCKIEIEGEVLGAIYAKIEKNAR